MTNIIVAFRNFTNAPKNLCILLMLPIHMGSWDGVVCVVTVLHYSIKNTRCVFSKIFLIIVPFMK